MIIQVPFIYNALIIKPRCRNLSVVAVKDVVDVEIKEFTSSELPVAFRFGNTEIRWDGSRLWDFYKEEPSLYDKEKKPKIKATASIVKFNTENYGQTYNYSSKGAEAPFHNFWHHSSNYRFYSLNPMHCHHKRFTDEDVFLKEDVVFRKWVSDSRDAIAQAAVDEALNMVFCDGFLYTVTTEPYYSLMTFGIGNNHGETIVFSDNFFSESRFYDDIPIENYFNALQLEEATRYARLVASYRGDSCSIEMPLHGHFIEVLIKEAVKIKENTFLEKENNLSFVPTHKNYDRKHLIRDYWESMDYFSEDADLLDYIYGRTFNYLEAKDPDAARKYWEGMAFFEYVTISDIAKVGIMLKGGKFVSLTSIGFGAVFKHKEKKLSHRTEINELFCFTF